MGDCPHWQPAIAVIVQFVTDVYLVNKLFLSLSRSFSHVISVTIVIFLVSVPASVVYVCDIRFDTHIKSIEKLIVVHFQKRSVG